MAARIVIDMDDNGQIKATWPRDRVLAYGMLEIAKDIMRTQQAKQDLDRIVPVGVIPNLGNGSRG